MSRHSGRREVRLDRPTGHGVHFTTLQGTYDELSVAFRKLVDDYVKTKYLRKATPQPAAAGS